MEIDDSAFHRAESLEASNPEEALKIYLSYIQKAQNSDDLKKRHSSQQDVNVNSLDGPTGTTGTTTADQEHEEELKTLESSIYKCGQLYAKLGKSSELVKLTRDTRPLYQYFPKTKGAKIIRVLIDQISKVQGENPGDDLVTLCQDTIKWSEEGKRSFLKSRIETRLASIFVDMKRYEQALAMLQILVKEMKQLDDKLLLVEIHLIETRACFACGNLPKAKAALTACKTNANAIHCPPLQQAEIDLWSGIVALREKDPRTAYSYLFEAFEGFRSNKDDSSHLSQDYTQKRALQSLKCQLMCVIIENRPAQARAIVQSKTAIKYAEDSSIQAILKIAAAYEERSLKKLEATLKEHPITDSIIEHHLKDLYDSFLEKNLLKILEPFSQVELSHIAELIELDTTKTTLKLSQMILDGKLLGTVDEGRGNLILYPATEHRDTCKSILETIKNASDCVDSLGVLMKKIAAA